MRRLALSIGYLAIVVGLIVSTVFGTDGAEAALFVIGIAGFPLVGYLILLSRPTNGVGLGLYLMGAFMALDGLREALGPSGGSNGALANIPLFEAGFVALVLTVVVFPSGKPTTRFDRYFLVVVVTVATFALVLMSFAPAEGTEPIAAIQRIGLFVRDDAFIIVPMMILIGVGSAIIRGIQAVGTARLQYKWFVTGAAVMATSLIVISSPLGDVTVAAIAGLVGIQALPICILVAVVRFRLYEIDRIISRTVTYTVVVALLAGVVALIATVVGTQFDSPLVVAVTTFVVAATFNPLRRRVQDWVDRRFNRSRYDAERVIDRFAGSLRDQLDPRAVVDGWLGVVSETMQPAAASVWVRETR